MDTGRYPIMICGTGEDCVVRLPWQDELPSAGLFRNYRERAYLGEILHRLENGERLPAAEQMDYWMEDGQTVVLQKN